MIAASDITGLFILPLSLTMHNAAYDIMNEMGLIFIPFTIIIVKAFFDARAQGHTEGNAATLFIKEVEVQFIKMFFVLIFFVMPATSSNATFEHAQYSQSTYPSLLTGTENVSELNPNTNFSDVWGEAQAPLGFGLLNNLSVGFSNTVLAKIPCTVSSTTDACVTDVSPGAIYETVKGIKPTQDDSNEAVMEFAENCYQKGLGNYLKASENDTETIDLLSTSFPDNSAQKYAFFSDFMNSVYLGVYDIDGYNNEPQLWITTSDEWDRSSIGGGGTVKCQVASLALYDLLLEDMRNLDNYDYIYKIMNAWVDYYSRYGGDANEIVATESLARQEFVSAMFINAYNSNNESTLELLDRVVSDVVEGIDEQIDDYTDGVEGRFSSLEQTYNSVVNDELDGKNGTEYLKALGTNALHLATSGIGAGEAYTSAQIQSRVFPVILQLSSAALLIFSPIVILLSGYNTRLTYRIIVMYVGLCFSPYVYELGQVIGNNIIAVAGDTDYTTQQFGEESNAISTLQSMWLGYKMPIILVGVWNLFLFFLSRMPLPFTIANPPTANIFQSQEVGLVTEGILDRLDFDSLFKKDDISEDEKKFIFDTHISEIEKEISQMPHEERKELMEKVKNSKKR